jgi:hypothetical protein
MDAGLSVQIVIPVVVGSSPISHPKKRKPSQVIDWVFSWVVPFQFTITNLPLTLREPMWA